MPISSYSDGELPSAIRHDDEKALQNYLSVTGSKFIGWRMHGSFQWMQHKRLLKMSSSRCGSSARNTFNKSFALVFECRDKKLCVELHGFTTHR